MGESYIGGGARVLAEITYVLGSEFLSETPGSRSQLIDGDTWDEIHVVSILVITLK